MSVLEFGTGGDVVVRALLGTGLTPVGRVIMLGVPSLSFTGLASIVPNGIQNSMNVEPWANSFSSLVKCTVDALSQAARGMDETSLSAT